MPVFGFVYLSAVFSVAYLRDLPSIALLISFLIVLLLSLFLLHHLQHKLDYPRAKKVIKLLYLFSVVFIISALHGHYLLSGLFDDSRFSRECRVQGVVVGIVQHPNSPAANVTRFRLKTSDAKCAEIELSLNVLSLSLYSKYLNADKFARRNQKQYVLRAGDKLTLSVKLKTPRSHFSEAVFDFKLWALNNGISATGYVREIISIEKDYAWLPSIRDRLTQHIDQLSITNQSKASLNALVLGNKQLLTDQQWQWLRATGTVHLLVVSGLHIAVIVAIGWWVGVLIRALLQMCNNLWRLALLPEVCALSLSFCYMLMAGAGLSTQRAWLMAFIMLLGNSFSYSLTLWQRWWLALIVIISWQPLSVLSPGLWLSFLAVASLICLQGLRDKNSKWALLLYSQLGVWFALTPLLLMFFQQVSLISPVVNLVAISYVSLLIILLVPALTLSVLSVPEPLQWLTLFIDYFWQVLEFIADYTKGAVIQLFPLEQAVITMLAIACFCLLIPIPAKLKGVVIITWLLIAYPKYPQTQPKANHFKLTLIDVGQGLAVLVQTQHHNLLFDTGAAFSSGFNYFDRNIKPLLDKRQLVSLDRLVISHTDNDHSGGLYYAQQQLEIKQLDSEKTTLFDVAFARCKSDERWQWEGIDFHYRQPALDTLSKKRVKPNNRSCVLQVSNSSCKVLIMGDAQRAVEMKLRPSDVTSNHNVLIAGHHGSNTSTSQYLLDNQQFESALISNGYANRYGHPHPKVLARLKQQGIKIYRTDLQGSIEVTSNTQGCEISSYRLKNKRFWW